MSSGQTGYLTQGEETGAAARGSRLRPEIIAGVAVAAGTAADWRLGLVLAVWLGSWWLNARLAASGSRAAGYLVPVISG